jgi:hypothetical protein
MPRLLHSSPVAFEWADLARQELNSRHQKKSSDGTRTEGKHLSGVIRYVLSTAGQLKTDDVSDELPLRMAFGVAWENWIAGMLPGYDLATRRD